MLLRDALGEALREARMSQQRTLRDVSNAANVSLGYLSEVERGRKEASSELLAAICDALDLELADVLVDVSSSLRRTAPRPEVTASAAARPMASVQARLRPPVKDLRIVLPYTASPTVSAARS